MAGNGENLARLVRAWRWRVRLTALSESVLCTLLGAGAAGVAVFAAWAAIGQARVASAEPAIGAAGFAILAGPLLFRRVRMRLRPQGGMLLDLGIGWLIGWIMIGPLWRQASGSSPPAWPIVAALAIMLVPAILRHMRISGRAVAAWLDQQTNSRMLLSTAGELAQVARQISHVEQAVLARADRLAATPTAFVRVSARRLPGRTWALLPVIALAVALAGWISTASARSAAAREAADAADQPHSANQLVAAQLAALARTAGEDRPPNVLNALENASAANDAASLDKLMRPLKAEMSATGRTTAEMTALAGKPAGQPIVAVLADPAQSPEQAADAARNAVEQWQADSLSPADRADLARQLRDAADRVRAHDPALAELLERTAAGLDGGDWQAVADGMAALAKRILPIVRRHRLAEAGVRILTQAILPSGQPFAHPTMNSDQPPGPGAAWWPRSDAATAAQLGKLTAEQQRIVRQYFDSHAGRGQ